MQKKLFFLILFISYNLSFSQVGGQSIYQFLNLISAPRQAALGGKIITSYDYDVNQPLYNPATINEEMNGKLGVNYGSYFGDVNYGTASYAYTFDEHLKTFHAGVSYINYGQFDGRDQFNNSTGSFSGSEAALSIGYAYNLPSTNLFIGANAKIISSTLESYNSFGVAADLGLIYKTKSGNVNYALVLRNMGTQITTYNGNPEKLPFEVMAGVSQELENVPIRWHVTLENLQQWEVSFSNPTRGQQTIDGEVIPEKTTVLGNAFRHVVFGFEVFPKRAFSIRLSYNFRRASELKIIEQRTFSGISAGFGIRFSKFRLDYAYSRYTLAANTSLFGLMINL
jgi:hypothetical protein